MTTRVFLSLCSSDTSENETILSAPEIFFSKAENQSYFAKIFPGLQDFLTQNKTYTPQKDFKALLWDVKHYVF